MNADRQVVEPMNGIFVGLLDANELAAFDRLCASGEAYRSYEGVAGFTGLAKVRLRESRDATS